jgi:hypothetical protein
MEDISDLTLFVEKQQLHINCLSDQVGLFNLG